MFLEKKTALELKDSISADIVGLVS